MELESWVPGGNTWRSRGAGEDLARVIVAGESDGGAYVLVNHGRYADLGRAGLRAALSATTQS